jgi:hypothetical protein
MINNNFHQINKNLMMIYLILIINYQKLKIIIKNSHKLNILNGIHMHHIVLQFFQIKKKIMYFKNYYKIIDQ